MWLSTTISSEEDPKVPFPPNDSFSYFKVIWKKNKQFKKKKNKDLYLVFRGRKGIFVLV